MFWSCDNRTFRSGLIHALLQLQPGVKILMQHPVALQLQLHHPQMHAKAIATLGSLVNDYITGNQPQVPMLLLRLTDIQSYSGLTNAHVV